jgi:hypothetical protein
VSAAMKRSGVTVVVSVNRIVGMTIVLQPGTVPELRGCECRVNGASSERAVGCHPLDTDPAQDRSPASALPQLATPC